MNGDDGLAPKREMRWGDDNVTPSRGDLLTFWKEGTPGVRIDLGVEDPGRECPDALASFLLGQLGAEGARWFPGEWNRGRASRIWATHGTEDFIGADGEIGRCPNPGALISRWQGDPIGSVAYLNGNALTVLWIHDPVELEVAVRVQAACAKLLDAWLYRHGLRPSEFAPGRWRGGFVVRPSLDRMTPLPMPTREALAAGPVSDRSAAFRARDLIGEASAIEIPAVEVPTRIEAQENRGTVARFLDSIQGRG